MRYKLLAFDMDGTLVVDESSWRVIHRHYRTQDAARGNLEAWDRGEIDYPEFMRRDISLWRPVPTIGEVGEILSSYTLAPHIKEVVSEIQRRGYQTAIITGGIDILACEVARALGIKHVRANGLEADEAGYLTGEGIFRVDPRRKDDVLSRLAEETGASMDECVAVGDSRYDGKFLNCAGLGVAVGRDPELAPIADVVIEDFEHFHLLLNYLGERT